ncbi:MAG: N-acetyltransferase [Chloroflexi bacterium]|nr:N-acetyltransferase [Chloroflexota bacterium]
MNKNLDVIHLQERNRFEIHVEGKIAELDYSFRDGVITFTHTGVPRELGGQGIGSHIVRAGLDYAREKGYKVIPLCSFVDAYIRRHSDEYSDLVA